MQESHRSKGNDETNQNALRMADSRADAAFNLSKKGAVIGEKNSGGRSFSDSKICALFFFHR